MFEAGRNKDTHSGVGGRAPSEAQEASGNVFFEGQGALRAGDHFQDGSQVISGAPYVLINGKQAARVGDPVNNGATVKTGASTVLIGNQGGAEFGQAAARTALDAARERVFSGLTDPRDKLILCLPEMAANMYAVADERDKPGWAALSEGAARWLEGPAYIIKDKFDNGPGEPVWCEWSWLMRYKRFREAVAEIYKPENLFSPKAKQRLNKILLDDRCFEGAGREFTYITTREEWRVWREHAYQGSAMEFWKFHMINKINPWDALPDGLAVLANVTVYALPNGYTELLPNGKWKVCLRRVALFIHDGIEFNDADQTLGWWRCPEGVTIPGLGTQLRNSHFNAFRARTGYGRDSRVICEPTLAWVGFWSYETSL